MKFKTIFNALFMQNWVLAPAIDKKDPVAIQAEALELWKDYKRAYIVAVANELKSQTAIIAMIDKREFEVKYVEDIDEALYKFIDTIEGVKVHEEDKVDLLRTYSVKDFAKDLSKNRLKTHNFVTAVIYAKVRAK